MFVAFSGLCPKITPRSCSKRYNKRINHFFAMLWNHKFLTMFQNLCYKRAAKKILTKKNKPLVKWQSHCKQHQPLQQNWFFSFQKKKTSLYMGCSRGGVGFGGWGRCIQIFKVRAGHTSWMAEKEENFKGPNYSAITKLERSLTQSTKKI